MNSINLGYFDGKVLHLIATKYINNTISLILVTNNNIEYKTITYYDRKIKFDRKDYIILNPDLTKDLKQFLIRKNVILDKVSIITTDDNKQIELTILHPRILKKFSWLI